MKAGLVFIFFAALVPSIANATTMYDTDLAELASQLRADMIQVERMTPAQRFADTALRHDMFEIEKTAHRLSEEAMAANLRLEQQGQAPSLELESASAASDEIDLAQSLTTTFMDTGNPIFWKQAQQVATMARNVIASR